MVMGYLSYIMIGLTIAAIVLFLTWYFLKSKKNDRVIHSGSKGKKNEFVGIMPRFWKPIGVQEIKKKLDLIEVAKIDGYQNYPSPDSTALVETETEIISTVREQYESELERISQFPLLNSNKNLEAEFSDLEDSMEANGYKQTFIKMRQDWDSKVSAFKKRINEAIEERKIAFKEYNLFRKENKIKKTRDPYDHNVYIKCLKLLVPIVLFTLEVYLNYNALEDAAGENRAAFLSFTIASINVGLAFLLGVMVWTHLMNGVTTSKKPRILFYGFFVAAYMAIFAYINLMLAVFRSELTRGDNLIATDFTSGQDIIDKAFKLAVDPFTNLGTISFDGAFLLVMGSFFAVITMIDGYFFRDPITGYQKVGDRYNKALRRVEKLKNVDVMLFDRTREMYDRNLDSNHNYRLQCVINWSKYIDIVQGLDTRYQTFTRKLTQTLDLSIKDYRTNNQIHREHPIPKHWIPSAENPALPAVDENFIKTFNMAYPEIAEYNINDDLKRDRSNKARGVILNEYKVMVEQYAEFFDMEREKINVYLEKLDDTDVNNYNPNLD